MCRRAAWCWRIQKMWVLHPAFHYSNHTIRKEHFRLRMLICFQWSINYISILFNLYIFSSISAFNSFILPGYHWLHVSITLLHSFFKTAANCNAINNTFPCICSKTFIGCIHVLVLLSAIDIPSCSLCAPRPTQSHLSSPHLLTASSNPTPCIHPLA